MQWFFHFYSSMSALGQTLHVFLFYKGNRFNFNKGTLW
jgi:hypothetical protein